jgi:hypothetical protein
MLDLANDENDDWMKKGDLEYREREKRIFEAALKAHKEKDGSPPN